jgi:hypothetical protein
MKERGQVRSWDAAEWVRDLLANDHPATWEAVRSEVLAACSGAWVADEQASEIRRVCGNGAA